VNEPVNLNKFRKAKARVDKQARTDTNAMKFGLTKAEKNQQALLSDNATRLLDGHKLDDPNNER
jgi:hypothetical protein